MCNSILKQCTYTTLKLNLFINVTSYFVSGYDFMVLIYHDVLYMHFGLSGLKRLLDLYDQQGILRTNSTSESRGTVHKYKKNMS